MLEHNMLNDAKKLLIKNILAGPRPGPEELFLMSEPYKKVWDEFDEQLPDWADILDPP